MREHFGVERLSWSNDFIMDEMMWLNFYHTLGI